MVSDPGDREALTVSVMVVAGYARPLATGARCDGDLRDTTMRKCDTPIISGPECDGHLGKFDDCLAEALYGWSLDSADASTGDSDFEGHLSLIIVGHDASTLIEGRFTREVAVPADNYLLWTASTGAVTLSTVDDVEAAWEIFRHNDARYGMWEQGCNPDDPDGHEDCADYDECQHPEWVNA